MRQHLRKHECGQENDDGEDKRVEAKVCVGLKLLLLCLLTLGQCRNVLISRRKQLDQQAQTKIDGTQTTTERVGACVCVWLCVSVCLRLCVRVCAP